MNKVVILDDFQAYAERLVENYKIPAVSLAVWHNEALHSAAAGTLNVNTGVLATTDSIFQIGSITKVMTACLIMQLVDEGRLELDKPVKHYLREFEIADREASQVISVRQLINHTSGISGDFFPDDYHQTGNPIARFVDRCNLLPLAHPVGKFYSYSNAAFAIAGRLIEIVTGGTWFDAMEERLFRPLGMTHAICRPMDVLRYRAAIGHVPDPNALSNWKQTERLYLTMGQAPVGSTPNMTAADLITFARAHLAKGVSDLGQQWLSESAISQMQQLQMELPKMSTLLDSGAGLGWGLHRTCSNGRLIFGHAGETLGQASMLRVVPDCNTCIAILINCGDVNVIQSITNSLLKELVDIDLSEPSPVHKPLTSLQQMAMIGDYPSIGDRYVLRIENGQLIAMYQDYIRKVPAQRLSLMALDDDTFVGYDDNGDPSQKLKFLCPEEDGGFQMLYGGGIMRKRVVG